MTLRPWQAAALPLALAALRSGSPGVVQACTGSGKSVLIAALLVALDAPAVVTVPTQALVEQLAATLAAAGLDVGRYYASAKEAAHRVVVVCHDSVTAAAPALQGRYLVCDEAHKTQPHHVEALAPVGRIGFTATPYRSDVAGTLTLWDYLVTAYTLADALRDGVLVPFAVEYQPHDADINAACVGALQRRPPVGPGVVSASSIADAEEFADALASAGYRAAAIHSRQPRTARVALIERLRVGDLAALVYPQLLSEGVDLPWLRWVMLRRRLGSRVALVQTVGRVVRSAPGKERALVYDPHDLLATHGLTHTAALGESFEPDTEDEEEVPDPWPVFALPPLGVEVPQSVAIDAAGAWVRAMLLGMELGTWGDPGASWRREPATEKQRAYLVKLKYATRFLTPDLRPGVNALIRRAEVLRAGVVSDLISILRSVADRAKPWIDSMRAQGRDPWRLTSPTYPVDLPSVPARLLKVLEKAA